MTRHTFPHHARIVSAVVAATLTLAACSSAPDEPEEPEVQRAVVSSTTPLDETEVEQLALPFALQELPTFTLPYDTRPQSLDGILFGLHETEGILQFTAVSTRGEQLWFTQRPATCSGYTLTTMGDTPIAVLTDVESTSDALAEVTASAYNLRTGDLEWGPVPVAGPWHGPGTVFAEAAPASAMGDVGTRQVLEPTTGEVLDTEEGLVGEFDGTILAVTGSGSEATVQASGTNEWRISVNDLVSGQDVSTTPTVTTLPGEESPAGFALLSVDNAQDAALVRLSDGEVMSTDATSAAWDTAAEMLIATEPGTLAGYASDGPAWSRELTEGLRISASGGVLTYLRSDTSVQVVNAVTGDDAVGYDPEATDYAIPTLITADGAAVFKFDQLTLVGTHGGP